MLLTRQLALLFCLCLLPLSAADKHTILAVFAHPDDETFIGGLLAKYAAEGHDVYLALTTSGQMGAANTNIPKGERLGAAREEEAVPQERSESTSRSCWGSWTAKPPSTARRPGGFPGGCGRSSSRSNRT